MRQKSKLLPVTAVVCLGLVLSVHAQTPSSPAQPAQSGGPAPIPTFKAASRLVAVEVVVKDHEGHNVTGLTANDFEVFEHVPGKHGQVPQKIASFRAISVTDLAAHDIGKPKLQEGVYTNLVTMDKAPVPPTVLLIDGINTDRQAQMQVHQQMMKMLSSIPDEVPVAVFLLGRRLVQIQDFTTDVTLLKAAIQKAPMVDSNAETATEPIDDPNALSATLENDPTVPAMAIKAVERFEREVYGEQMDVRVRETLDALRAISRHLAGYPGRKNLLWISSSFPIAIDPDQDLQWAGFRTYQDDMVAVTSALADAKVAVYPMDPAGLTTLSMFQAGTRMRGDPTSLGTHSTARQIERENDSTFNRQESMKLLAEQTGGTVCVNNNDLGECVKKAVNDGSMFYEIAYYPDSSEWHGEFHKIVVKSHKSGLRLSYRQGYYARRDESSNTNDKELQQVACQDYLTSTSLLMVVKQFPADKSGEVKISTVIQPAALTFTPQEDGTRRLDLRYGICSFDKTGKPLQFMHRDYQAIVNDQQYNEIQSQRGLQHVVVFPVLPGASRLRLIAKDLASGEMGSVDLPYAELMAASPASPTSNGAGPAAH